MKSDEVFVNAVSDAIEDADTCEEAARAIMELARARDEEITLAARNLAAGLLDRFPIELTEEQKIKETAERNRQSRLGQGDAGDQVDHPEHYGGAGNLYEVIRVLDAWGCAGLQPIKFQVIKYTARAGKKGDALEDLAKARWYLDWYITEMEKARERYVHEQEQKKEAFNRGEL